MRMKILLLLSILSLSAPAYSAVIETGTFESGLGHELQFIAGIPATLTSKIFINIEGDGQGCKSFVSDNIKKLANLMSSNDMWVIPETSKQYLCLNGQYKFLDFHHRLTEITNLVQKLKSDGRFSKSKIYLMGSSGGVDLVSRSLHTISDVDGVILIAGFTTNLESAFYNKELIDGRKKGLSEEQIQANITKWQNLFSKIKSNCSSTVFDWGDRNNLFWCQMFSGDVAGNILTGPSSIRIFVVHGALDDVIPVEEAYSTVSKLASNSREVSSLIIPDMGHKMYPFIKDILTAINSWVK